MHFGLSEEQEELASSVRKLVERRAAALDVRSAASSDVGYDGALWETLCGQVGVASLAVPEEHGGAGFSSFETHVVLEELGASLTPSPLLGSGVLATRAALLWAAAEGCDRLLPAIAAGSSTAALAWADAKGRWRTDGADVQAVETDERWRLDGVSTLVLDASGADTILVVATTGHGPALFEVPRTTEGLEIVPTPALDPTLDLATVTLRSVEAARLSTDATSGETVLSTLHAEAAVAVTALQVGGAQRALDLTVAHLKEREQFGRPLGSFQALKHRVADMLVKVETARSVSWSAAWAVAQGSPDLQLQAATAKAWCSDAFSEVAGEMVQLHGGIAITWEHDAHLYFKRAHATGQLFGSASQHRRRLLAAQ